MLRQRGISNGPTAQHNQVAYERSLSNRKEVGDTVKENAELSQGQLKTSKPAKVSTEKVNDIASKRVTSATTLNPQQKSLLKTLEVTRIDPDLIGRVRRTLHICVRLEQLIADLEKANQHANIRALTSQGSQSLTRADMECELIINLAEQADDPDRANVVRNAAEDLRKTIKSLRSSLRLATISAEKAAATALRNERESLLEGSSDARHERLKRAQNTESAVDASIELTESIWQAVQMMANEVDRSAQTAMAMEDMTNMLSRASDQYRTYESVLRTTRHFVDKLKRRDILDRLLIYVGLFIFVSTVFSILRRRLGIWIPGWRYITHQCPKGYDEWCW